MNRYGRLLDDLLRKHRHASQQEILGFLDGELADSESEWVRDHLAGCWSCRAAAEKTGQAVAGFIEYRGRTLAQRNEEWSDGWPSIESRVRTMEDPPERGLCRSFLAAPALALLAAGFLVFLLTSTPPVSAAAALENARRAEQAATGDGSLVTYRKLAIRRRSATDSLQTAVFEVWADGRTSRIRTSGARTMAAEIEAVFAANNRRQPPLSAAGFAAWRNGAKRKHDAVVPGKNAGLDVVTVKTAVDGASGVNAIREDQITIRTDTWAPVTERISVGEKDRERTFEFEAVETRLVDRGSINDAQTEPPNIAARVPASTAAPFVEGADTPAAKADAGLLDEIAAHYALHRLGICLDGAVEIVPHPGEILVTGVLESEQRKAELERALADIPAVRIQLQSADAVTPADGATPAAPVAVITVKSGSSPLHKTLLEFFQANPEKSAALANEAVSHARDLRRHSWAVRRLAERFADSVQLGHSAPSRWLLEVMIRDHAGRLEAETAALQSLLDPLLQFMSPKQELGGEAGQPPAGSWKTASAEVFGNQREIETIIHQLFTGEGEAAPADALAVLLQTRLAALRKQTRTLSERAVNPLSNSNLQETIP